MVAPVPESVIEEGAQRADHHGAGAGRRVPGDGAQLVDLLEARGRVGGVEQLRAGAPALRVELGPELRLHLVAQEPAAERERLGDAGGPRFDATAGGRDDRDAVVDLQALV